MLRNVQMETKMLWISLHLCLLLLATHRVASQDQCPTEAEALGTITFVASADENLSLRLAASILQNEDDDLTDDDRANLTQAVIERTIDEAFPDDIKAPGDVDPGTAADLNIAVPYYYHTCPYKWFLIQRGQWYWRTEKTDGSVKTIEYWFSYWWVWSTFCGLRHCSLSYFPFTVWDARFRCWPEFRYIYIPVVCYRITIEGDRKTGKWVSWTWRRVWVPRGCCCRKYWWWITANDQTCAALSSG